MFDNVNFLFNEEKNEKIKFLRGVQFAEVKQAVKNGNLLDVEDHPNQQKYPNQKIMYVLINDYAYAVPYVQQDQENIFLKTIFPSRKAKKAYLKS